MNPCQWKPPAGSVRGIVVWSVEGRHGHCPRCCGIVVWHGTRGTCATGHTLVIDPRPDPMEQLLRDIFQAQEAS